MITLCKEDGELFFLPPDPFAARITAYCSTYGFECGFAMFWSQTVNGKPVAAIAKIDGDVTLCCCEGADYEELSAFLNAVGYSTLTSEEKNLVLLGIKPVRKSYIVQFNSQLSVDGSNILNDYDKKAVYDLLCGCGFELGDYRAFLADVCSRLNKGTAKLACIDDNGLKACAFKLFIGSKSVLLGAVATKPEARGKGYASSVVQSLASEEKNKKVFLFCREDSLLAFYSRIGFEECGIWAVAHND